MKEIEYTNQLVLPTEFVTILTEFSAAVSFQWIISEEDQEYIHELFSGGSLPLWNINSLKECKEIYEGWIECCFPNPNDEYDKVWWNKTAFLSIMNGDMLAFDTSNGNQNCPVVYLSHDGDDEMHGKILGDNFIDFVSKWSALGCPGPEWWQMHSFYNFTSHTLDISGKNAQDWLNWLKNGALL